MSDKLKPCPFCGGRAMLSGCEDWQWTVVCNKCDYLIGDYEPEREAIEAWNLRIEPKFTPDELDAIRRMFAERYPRASKLPEIEQSIIDKCELALKRGAR